MSDLDSSVIMEIEATEFALNLLLPDDLMKAYIEKHPAVASGDDRAVIAMAKAFGVPLVAPGMRLGDIRRKHG